MSMRDYLLEATKDFSIRLTETQLSQLERYHELLAEWNEKINLTAITDDMGVAVKHFADSMTVFQYIDIPQGAKIIDVGTGAGFPGLVLKIVRPDIQLTLLDSLQKRLNFLGIVLKELSLDAELIHARAEEGGQNDSLRLSEFCLPYVRLSGQFIAFKGNADGEVQASKKAIGILGGKVASIHRFDLPLDGGARMLVAIEKEQPTPAKYPRPYGKIKTKPL